MLRDTPTLPFTTASQDGHRKPQRGRAAQARFPQIARTLSLCRKYPSKGVKKPCLRQRHPRNLGTIPHAPRSVSAPEPWGRAQRVRILVTGVSGYVGASLVPRLRRDGHELRGFARSRERGAAAGVALDDLVLGDAVAGTGLAEALDGIDVAYYLIHSMEGAAGTAFPEQERHAAEAFGTAASDAGVRRVVYLGGLVPAARAASRHLARR